MIQTLTASLRTEKGTTYAKKIRKEKKIPAIIYGAKQKEALPIVLDSLEFQKVWESAGESTIISVVGIKGVEGVLIQDVAFDPVYENVIHADLLSVDKDTEIEATIPLIFEGSAPAEKELGGIVMKITYEVDVRTLPKNLPPHISVDISSLKTFDDVIRLKDLKVGEGVELLGSLDESIVLVQAPKETEEEENVTDVSQVEVVEKGKKEKEEQ